jgi:predicted site-specific integrase-resolvase
MKDYLTTYEASQLAQVSPNKLWNLMRAGLVPGPDVRGGRAFWNKHDIEQLARRLRAEAKAAEKAAVA